MNRLYYGDNLTVLREQVADESVDLVYLDPPFNSKRDYNLLFKTPKGHQSDAQITAFQDSWHWGEQAEAEYEELLHQPNTDIANLMPALLAFLDRNDMMAYLVMMANRLLELHRVLKSTGSLYLHCDPTASHYLRVVLDGVFGKTNLRNEIIWKRTSAHNDPRRFGTVHDTLLFYAKDKNENAWNAAYTPYTQDYIDTFFKFADADGRRFWTNTLTAPGPRPHLEYEWKGVMPPKGRCWAMEKEKLEEMDRQGRIYYSKNGFPLRKYYLDETKGSPVQDIWTDIDRVGAFGGNQSEKLGYPTQKPLALLERIINASSNLGDTVLDPFCGCGTAVHAAQKLGRRWIGIDITHLAIALIEKRLKDAFPYLHRVQGAKGAPVAPGVGTVAEPDAPAYVREYEVLGTPTDIDGARDLAARDKYQFQWWACALVNAQPFQGRRKGADGGIDGLIFFQDDKGTAKKIVVSVKGGEHVSVAMVRDLAHVVERENAAIGLFVTLAEPTKPMVTEATSTGFYTSPATGAEFPRVQILTIDGLLSGAERARYPDLARGGLTFKKAKREAGSAEQGGLF